MRTSVVFWTMRALAMNWSSSGNFTMVVSLPKVPVHESSVHTAEPGDAVEDISPQIEIVPLMDNPVVIAESKLGAAIDGRAGESPEHHHHFPLKESIAPIHDNREDIHSELLAAFGEPIAHGGELCDALDPLDAVFENNVFVIIGEEMRPVGLPSPVVGLGPELADPFDC
jgi:hypothetical protein